MKILVTGVSGLVGNLIVRRLISQDHAVVGLLRDPQKASALKNIIQLAKGDITVANLDPEIFQDVETVIHCAGLVGSGRGADADYMEINANGTRNLLDAVKKTAVKRFVFISTAAVYGTNMLKGNIDENTAYGTGNGYSKSKIAAENFIKASGIPYTILRPYWITGGGDRFFIPQVGNLLKNNAFYYIGNGDQQMSLSAVENISQAIALAAVHPKAINRIYNLADETIQIKQAVEIIANAIRVPLPTQKLSVVAAAFKSLLNQSPSNPARMGIDLFFPLWRTMTINANRIREELDWTPQTHWQDSLKQGVIEWAAGK